MRNPMTRRAGFAGLAVASIVILAGCGTGGGRVPPSAASAAASRASARSCARRTAGAPS